MIYAPCIPLDMQMKSSAHPASPITGLNLLGIPASASMLILIVLFLLGLTVADYGIIVLLAILGVAALFLFFKQPFIALLLMATTIPLENVFKVASGVTFTRVMGFVVLAVWLCWKLVNNNEWKHILSATFLRISLALFMLAFTSLLWAPNPNLRAILQLAQMIVLAIIIIDLVDSWDRAVVLFRLLAVAGVIASAMTVIQYFGKGVSRAGGQIAGGVNETSALLVALMPVAFFLIRAPGKKIWQLVGLAYLGLGNLAVLVTFSRQSYLLLPLTLIVLYWQTFRYRYGRGSLALVTGLVALIALILIPYTGFKERALDRINTIVPDVTALITGNKMNVGDKVETSARGFHWRVGLEMFKDYPLLGIGYGNYGKQFIIYQFRVPGGFSTIFDHARSSHSSNVNFLADLGLVGLGLWLVLLGHAIRESFVSHSLLSKSGSLQNLFLTQSVCICVLLQTALSIFHQVHTHKQFWIFIAMSAVIQRLVKNHTPIASSDGKHPRADLLPASSGSQVRRGGNGITIRIRFPRSWVP